MVLFKTKYCTKQSNHGATAGPWGRLLVVWICTDLNIILTLKLSGTIQLNVLAMNKVANSQFAGLVQYSRFVILTKFIKTSHLKTIEDKRYFNTKWHLQNEQNVHTTIITLTRRITLFCSVLHSLRRFLTLSNKRAYVIRYEERLATAYSEWTRAVMECFDVMYL